MKYYIFFAVLMLIGGLFALNITTQIDFCYSPLGYTCTYYQTKGQILNVSSVIQGNHTGDNITCQAFDANGTLVETKTITGQAFSYNFSVDDGDPVSNDDGYLSLNCSACTFDNDANTSICNYTETTLYQFLMTGFAAEEEENQNTNDISIILIALLAIIFIHSDFNIQRPDQFDKPSTTIRLGKTTTAFLFNVVINIILVYVLSKTAATSPIYNIIIAVLILGVLAFIGITGYAIYSVYLYAMNMLKKGFL